MGYSEIKPHPALQLYIDAYWISENTAKTVQQIMILPDGCVDIIFNLEDDYQSESGTILMKSGAVHFVGTMMRHKMYRIIGKTKMLGIRFKPAAFFYFFKFPPLSEFTDQNIELKTTMLPTIHHIDEHTQGHLDNFFLNRLSAPKYPILPIINEIRNQHGLIKVNELAKTYFTTNRQLERHFQNSVGVSPKEFIRLVRYQFTYHKIKNNTAGKCLATIAFESGYYDHAHLTNEIKKFTGSAPSQL